MLWIPENRNLIVPNPHGRKINWESGQANGLIGFWVMDEGSGQVVNYVNGDVLTTIGGSNWKTTSTGVWRKWLGTGTYAYVTATGNGPFAGLSQLTLSVDLQATANAILPVIAHRTGYAAGMYFGLYNGYCYLVAGNTNDCYINFSYSSESENRITMVYDGTQANNIDRVKFYVNSLEITNKNSAWTMPTAILPVSSTTFINFDIPINAYGTGNTKNLLAWNRALNSIEVSSIDPLKVWLDDDIYLYTQQFKPWFAQPSMMWQ